MSIDSEPVFTNRNKRPYRYYPPKPGHRQALLTCWVGGTQLSQVEWVPQYIQAKAQVRVGQDDKVWVVEEIY